MEKKRIADQAAARAWTYVTHGGLVVHSVLLVEAVDHLRCRDVIITPPTSYSYVATKKAEARARGGKARLR